MDAYSDVTENAFGYILLGFRKETQDDLRIRTKVFQSDKDNTQVYMICENRANTRKRKQSEDI